MCSGQSVVIDGKIYFGGGKAENEDDCYRVYCYNPAQDKWTSLPSLPVKYFGLGKIDGKLVAVGGEMKDGSKSLSVYTFDTRWKQNFPPLLSVRLHPAVISHKSMLVVAGGEYFDQTTKTVETCGLTRPLWYKTPLNSLPTSCIELSTVSSDSEKKYYAIGGKKGQQNLNQAMYLSVDDLHWKSGRSMTYSTTDDIPVMKNLPTNPLLLSKVLSNSVDDLRHTAKLLKEKQENESPWKVLPNTPTYSPAAAMLAGSLIAVGGWDKPEKGTPQTNIFKYSSGIVNSWIYIGDLPAPRAKTTAAVLSPTEVLVIGGWDGSNISQAVYKLTLHLD